MRENIDVNLQLIALLTGRKIKVRSRCQEMVYLKMLAINSFCKSFDFKSFELEVVEKSIH